MTLVVLIGLYLAFSIFHRPAAAPGFLLGASLLFISPSILSIEYQPIGFLFLALAAVWAVGISATKISPRVVLAVLPLVVLHGLLVAIDFALRGFVSTGSMIQLSLSLVIGLSALPVLSRPENARAACRFLANAVVCSALSFVITRTVQMLAGNVMPQVGNLTSTYGSPLPVLFPFTTYLGTSAFLTGEPIERWTGLAREPGMMALYCLVGFVLLRSFESAKYRVFATVILALGVLGTGSSTGVVIFILAVTLSVALRLTGRSLLRNVWAVLIACFGLLFLSPSIGQFADFLVEDKAARDDASLSGRVHDTADGLRALRESPILGLETNGESYSLVGGIAELGVGYPILTMATLFAIVHFSNYSPAVTIGAIGVFATFLLTQPATGTYLPFVALLALGMSNFEAGQSGRQLGSDNGLSERTSEKFGS